MGRTVNGLKNGENKQVILCDYRTEKAIFEHLPGASADSRVDLVPRFFRNCVKEEDGLYLASLGVRIDEPDKIPYRIEVVVSGTFRFVDLGEDDINHVVGTSVVNILFPYLRATLAALMAISGIPAVHLPVINAATLFSHLAENEQ